MTHPFDLCMEYTRIFIALNRLIEDSPLGRPASCEEYQAWKAVRHNMWRQYHLSQNTSMSASKRALPPVCRDAIDALDQQNPHELEQIQSLLTYMDMDYPA